jgi:hypothetical protein
VPKRYVLDPLMNVYAKCQIILGDAHIVFDKNTYLGCFLVVSHDHGLCLQRSIEEALDWYVFNLMSSYFPM